MMDRLNKLDSGSGSKVSKRQFVNAFNKMQLHWMEKRVEMDEINKTIQTELQQFTEEHCKSPSIGKNKQYCTIDVPEDFFHYRRVFGINCGDCDHTVYAYAREEGAVNMLLLDDAQRPSMEWQETFFTIANDKIRFYTDGEFKCKQVTLVYYRCPREIDMLGIISDCKGKADIDPELDKASLQEVLDLTTLLLAEDIMDQARYSTIAARIQMFN